MTDVSRQRTITEEPPDAIDSLSDILENQSSTIAKLTAELAASYQKELMFFENLESRDRDFKAQENKYLKKIWWLESQLREVHQRSEKVSADLQRLKGSRMVRAQYKIWRLRKRVRLWR